MRLSSLVMLAVALVFGVAAALFAKIWLEGQVSEPRIVKQPAVTMGTVVTAARPLRFGMELAARDLREVDWPEGAIPDGAFASIAEIMDGSAKRVVLSAVAANEPVLKWKITGPGQRASLSALIAEDKKAVSIRVNDVLGVAGFVLPGEHVDVLLTWTQTAAPGDSAQPKSSYTDVLLQNVRVLAVDQLADDRSEKPSVVKTVTVEVDTDEAQKLALASSVGQLSLALRRAGARDIATAQRVSLQDLAGATGPAVAPAAGARVAVTRGLLREEYRVLRHDPQAR